jgi:nicotinamide-nucleotide amidase
VTLAADVVDALRSADATVATAESLTGGLLCATLVSVSGASDVVRGGVVAYAPELKTALLGVDADLIATQGTVTSEVALAMAVGVRDRLGATYGLSTTGVAGPGPSEGKPAGTVHVAVAGPGETWTTQLDLVGDRDTIRSRTVDALLSWLVARLGEESRPDRG